MVLDNAPAIKMSYLSKRRRYATRIGKKTWLSAENTHVHRSNKSSPYTSIIAVDIICCWNRKIRGCYGQCSRKEISYSAMTCFWVWRAYRISSVISSLVTAAITLFPLCCSQTRVRLARNTVRIWNLSLLNGHCLVNFEVDQWFCASLTQTLSTLHP